MTEQESEPSQSPVPSITLQITKKDADRFLEASEALKGSLEQLASEKQSASSPVAEAEKHANDKEKKPLHEMLYDAARKCDHTLVIQFLDRMATLIDDSPDSDPSSSHHKELQAATLIFHESDKTTKLRNLFSILSSAPPKTCPELESSVEEEKKDDNPKLSQDDSEDTPLASLNKVDATLLFKIVLMAISSCVHPPEQTENENVATKNEKDVVVEGEPSANNETSSLPEEQERPAKRRKIEEGDDATATTKPESVDEELRNTCQSPSWDSSLATLRDEEDKPSPTSANNQKIALRLEIEEIAKYAADQLFRFVSCEQQDKKENMEESSTDNPQTNDDAVTVDFSMFGNWYNKSGSKIVPWLELLQHGKWKPPAPKHDKEISKKELVSAEAPSNAPREEPLEEPQEKMLSPAKKAPPRKSSPHLADRDHFDKSRTLVSFDFNGSGSPTPLLINISEDNLYALQAMVKRTNLIKCSAADICKTITKYAYSRSLNGKEHTIIRREDFQSVIKKIIPFQFYRDLSKSEKECYIESFMDFFSCFESSRKWLKEDEVDAMEFAVGFCFFCAGNKSSKLLTGFQLLDSKNRGFLTEDQLSLYLQSYLTILVALSLLMPISKRHQRRVLDSKRRKELRSAVESGAKWTLGHFLKASGQTKNEYAFECFAQWYSSGGYNIAPWLELLDLKKVMSLISDASSPLNLPPLDSSGGNLFQTTQRKPAPRDRVSSLRRHHLSRRGPPPEILFTFPLGNRRSLVVLKEDATYVRGVVEQLGLLTMKPDSLWSILFKAVEKRRKPKPGEPAVYVDKNTFVDSMKEICRKSSRKRSSQVSEVHATSSSVEEILANFYQCFDIDQCDRVALDELMGGLTLLCGGKKSTKLAFAFSIFDTRPGMNVPGKKGRVSHSLSGEDLFLFLRSILIVTFSTCRQSLDMTDETVGRCIADTANMICNDVMRHQWESKRLDRLDFDEFGQWYNDGGFERAPWLELLDLKKWVLVDDYNSIEKQVAPAPPELREPPVAAVPSPPRARSPLPSPDAGIPPPPPEEALDNSFLDEIDDSMDEMDMILMQTSSIDRDELKLTKSLSYSHSPHQQAPPSNRPTGNPLKFHLVTTEEHGGYMLSLSAARISHFRRLLESSGLHTLDAESACNEILRKGSHSRLSRDEFDSAVRDLLFASNNMMDEHAERELRGVFSHIFEAFDYEARGKVSAIEVACGLTVLCRGKKSDKLEFAFEVLDKNKRGRLSRKDMANYLQSFLTVLLCVAFSTSLEYDAIDDTLTAMDGSHRERSTLMLIRAVKGGADWAASLAFQDLDGSQLSMSFDDFASWYTRVGYSSIPWLELLDLQKWAMLPEPK